MSTKIRQFPFEYLLALLVLGIFCILCVRIIKAQGTEIDRLRAHRLKLIRDFKHERAMHNAILDECAEAVIHSPVTDKDRALINGK